MENTSGQRIPRSRPKQDDRLLPLGGYQYLTMLACRELAGEESLPGVSAPRIQDAIVRGGLSEASLGQLYVTLHRLAARGLISPKLGRSEVDPTRAARTYSLTPAGHGILRTAERNFRRIGEVADYLGREIATV